MKTGKLINLSKYLDDSGLFAEADYLKSLIKKIADEDTTLESDRSDVFVAETAAKERLAENTLHSYSLYDLYAFYLGKTPGGGYPKATQTSPPRLSQSNMLYFFNTIANDEYMANHIVDTALSSGLAPGAEAYIKNDIEEMGRAQLDSMLRKSTPPEDIELIRIKEELGIPKAFDIGLEESFRKEESDDEIRFNKTLGKYKDQIGIRAPKTAYWYPLDMEKLDEHISVYEDILSQEDLILIKGLIGKYKNLGWAMPGQRGQGFEGLLARPWGTYSTIDLNKIMLNDYEGYQRLMEAYYRTI